LNTHEKGGNLKPAKRNDKKQETELQYLEKIKKLAVISMFSDDELMGRLVLKGGNAIDLIYRLSSRASVDVDFSIENEFEESELEIIETKIRKVLEDTYLAENIKVFDIKFTLRPSKMEKEASKFWGGYRVEFKVTPKDVYEENKDKLDYLRRSASVVGPSQSRTFKIDISKFEYCTGKKEEDLDGYTIYVYSPEMLAIEKIRAICQQMPEYKEIVKTLKPSPRPRDFFDIYLLINQFSVDLKNDSNIELLKRMFEIKMVPLSFLKNIEKYRDYHKAEFASLKDTIKAGMVLKEFDFYFDYVVKQVKGLPI